MRTSRTRSPRPGVALAAALLVAVLGLGGCADPPAEFGGSEGGATGARVASSPDAAVRKLRLQLMDPCYTDPDPRSVWPRCGRWVEETASTARTAAEVLPADPAVAAAADAVSSARTDFTARGCPGTAPTAPPDAGACVGALRSARDAAGALAGALRLP